MNQTKKINTCPIIRDLLPLYHDDVCTPESRSLVEDHISSCPDCKAIADSLDITFAESILEKESGKILHRHLRKEKIRWTAIGILTAEALTILVCLICNLAIGHALDWFFIVLTSLAVLTSVTVVPIILQKKEQKLLGSLCCFIVSLLLLLMTCAIYTGGDWFFLAATSSLLGLSVIFAPLAAKLIFRTGVLSRCKGILAMSWNTLWLYLLIFVCGFHSSHDDYFRIALQITSVCVVIAWGIFLFLRYAKPLHKIAPSKGSLLIKAGILLFLLWPIILLLSDVINYIITQKWEFTFTHLDLGHWTAQTLNSNIHFLCALLCLVSGLILLSAGLHRARAASTSATQEL